MTNGDELGDDRELRVALGVMLCVAGSIVGSLGLTLQKWSFNIGELESPLYLRWRWWLGFFLLCILGGLLCAAALTYCPLSMVAPFAALTIITNSVMATWVLGEQIHRIEMIGTLFIVLGTATTAVFSAAHDETMYTGAQLWDIIFRWDMLILYAVMLLNVAVSSFFIRKRDTSTFVEMICIANIAGCMGGNSNLLLKCSMGLRHELQNPGTYLMILFTIVVAIAQLVVMSIGLARHPAVKYLPMYQSTFMVYGVLAGGVFFQEFSKFTLFSWIIFPLGICSVMFGLWLFTLAVPEEEDDASLDTAKEDAGDPTVEDELSDEMPLLAGSSEKQSAG